MDASAFSPRRLPSPHRRTPRTPLPPASCVDVQWTFLPPRSPLHNPVRRADCFDNPQAQAELYAEQARLRAAKDAAEAHEQRVLYDLMGETQRQAMLDNVMAEMEAMALMPVKRLNRPRRRRLSTHQQPSPIARRSSVLHPSVGKRSVELLPQRKVSSLGVDETETSDPVGDDTLDASDESTNSNDDGEDPLDDKEEDTETRRAGSSSGIDHIPELRAIRDRHQRRSHRKSLDLAGRPLETHIRWQKSAHVCVAMDLPTALVQGDEDEDDDHNMDCNPLAEMFPLSEESTRLSERSRSKKLLTQNHSPPKSESKPDLSFQPPLDFALSPRTQRVRKAPYGSWYVPREEWWPLHQSQQDALAEQFPSEQPTTFERHHCEPESPNQRRYRMKDNRQPTLPHAWPSVLRSPSPRTSQRIIPLVRPPTTVSSLRPTSPRPFHTHRSSSSSRASCVASPPRTPHSPGGLHPSPRDPLPVSPRRCTTRNSSMTAAAPDAIALRAAVLQKEIPNTYIAREYRQYLVSKGARVPGFLGNS